MSARRWAANSVDPRWRPILTGLFSVVAVGGAVGSIVRNFRPAAPVPGDYPAFGGPGARILAGDWSGVFRNSDVQAGPFELVFWGIPHLLGIQGSQWLAVDAVTVALSLVAVGVLSFVALRDVASFWRLPLAIGVTALVSVSGLVFTTLNSAHPAEIAIPLVWTAAALAARRGRATTAGVLIGLSAGWELWGALGAPILLLLPALSWRTALRAAAGTVVPIALCLLPFVLLGPFRMFEHVWPIFDGTLPHLLVPGAASFGWPLRLAQGAVSVGTGAAIAIALRRQRDAIWLVPLTVCVIRMSMDPVLWQYYSMTPALLAGLGLAFAIAQRRPLPALGCLIIFALLADFGRLDATTAIALLLATSATAVVTVTAARAPTRQQGSRAEPAA